MLAAYHLNQIEIDEEQLKTMSKQLQILKFDGKLSYQNQLNIIKSANITLINLLNKYKQLITSIREFKQNKQKRRQQIKKQHQKQIHNLNIKLQTQQKIIESLKVQRDDQRIKFKTLFIQYEKACNECTIRQMDHSLQNEDFEFLTFYYSKDYDLMKQFNSKITLQDREQFYKNDYISSVYNSSHLNPNKETQQDRFKILAENQQHNRKNHWRKNRFKFFSKFLGIHESNPNQENDGKEEQKINKTPNQMNKFMKYFLKEAMAKRSLRKNECNECGWFENIDDPQTVSKTSKKDGKFSIPHNMFSGPKRTSSLPPKGKQEQ